MQTLQMKRYETPWDDAIYSFVKESNYIEGILRAPTDEECLEMKRFMKLDVITVADLEQFVSVYQPNAKLRVHPGLDVRVGSYYPPKGGVHILSELESLLAESVVLTDYHLHMNYEMLHPFTDGNGRSGRVLWAWKHRDIHDGFLRPFYYRSLQLYDNKMKFIYRPPLMNEGNEIL